MFSSLKSLILIVGSIVLSIVIAIAYYGHFLFQETILYSVENTQKQQELNRIIISMKYPLTTIEGAIYNYLISLDENDKKDIPSYINELRTLLTNFKQKELIIKNKVFQNHIQKLEINIQELSQSFNTLSNFSREDRYPFTRIITTRLNPTNDLLNKSVQILKSAQNELKIIKGMENIELEIQQLHYVLAQAINSTRLLFVSKAEIFGPFEATLNLLLQNQTVYQRLLNDHIQLFEFYLTTNKLDLEVEEAISTFIEANKKRNALVDEIVNDLKSKQWRKDLGFMKAVLKPQLFAIQAEFNLMERRLENLTSKNTKQAKDTSNLLMQFLWLFTGMTIFTIILFYLIIEKWIRIPLVKISNAMHFEREQVSGNFLKHIGIKEIDKVIASFNLMRKELKTRQQRLSYILKNAGEGIIVITKDGTIDSFNNKAEHIFKTTESNVQQMPVSQFFDTSSIKNSINSWINNNSEEQNHTYHFLDAKRTDNSTFKCDITQSHMLLNKQEFSILVIRDASKRLINEKNLQQSKEKAENISKLLKVQVEQLDRTIVELQTTQDQLIESEKSAGLGSLVAGVAHEINTPIGVSVTASSHLSQEIATLNSLVESNKLTKTELNNFLDDASEASDIIENNLQRAANLVKSFKRVAVDQTSNENREINLRNYIDEVILNLRPKLKKTKHMINNNIDQNFTLYTSPGALSQIFTNLILNSLIHGFEHINAGIIDINCERKQNGFYLSYSDSGKGMDENQCKQVFEPFFTTKRNEGGSGLGMHIVYNLVTQALNGTIKCKSDVNNGCHFNMTLPYQKEAESA